MAALGEAVAGIAADIGKQRDTVDVARAEAHKARGFIDAENEFSQDGDYSTFGKRAPERTGKIVDEAANLIRNPQMRERWKVGAQTDAARTNDAIGDRGRALGRQAETNAFDDALEVNRRIYVDPDTSDDAKAKARADIEGAISTAEQSGLLTPNEAASRRDKFVSGADFSRAKLAAERDPSAVLPGDIDDRIIGVESGGRADAKNPNSSATGAGQFIASTWMNMIRQYRPELAEGRTAQEVLDLRKDPNISREMVRRYRQENQQFLRNQGIAPTDGDTYLAHFLGPRGAAQVIKADPGASIESIVGSDVVSANGFLRGKTAADVRAWAAKKMGANVPGYMSRLSPEERQIVYNQAETRQRQIAVEQRGAIETVVQNAPVAIQNTGTYDGVIPTRQQFVDAYGPEEGGDRYNNFSSALEVSQQAHDFRTMSVGDIETAVNAARPVSSGDDAVRETARYESLSKAAAQTIAARNADPATYAQQAFPNVAQAWQDAATTGNYRAAMTATANAQRQLGITDMKLMPKSVADQAITSFRDVNAPEQDRIGAVTGLVFATPDPQQQRAVFEQLVDAGLPDTTEGAIEAYARGDEGAGRRLMEAAIVDPSKLPGVAPFKPAEIDAEIQSQIMDAGQVGDIVYGLTDGTVENQERAIRDSKLLTNAVSIRVRNGETLEAAVEAASKDLYGDVQAVSGNGDVNAQIVIPAEADPAPVLDGLAGLLPTVRGSLESTVVAPAGAPVSDGSKAVIDAARANYIENVMAEGYFRNAGDGYVFIDPFVGAAVTGPDGQPLIFRDSDLIAAPRVERPVAANVDDIPQNRPQTPEDVRQSEYGRFADMPEETPERPAVGEPEPNGGGGGW